MRTHRNRVGKVQKLAFPFPRAHQHSVFQGSLTFRNSEISAHQRIIPQEHLCVECGKTFVSLERVNEHKALIHKTDAIMHNCKICKKSFKNERIYKAHTKSNHLNLPCSMCDKKFCSRRALNNHNKKKHENPTIDPPNFKYSDH